MELSLGKLNIIPLYDVTPADLVHNVLPVYWNVYCLLFT